MHTTRLPGGWYAHHNGDFSGEIIFQREGTAVRADIPSVVILALAAEIIRNERIRKLEQADVSELLGLNSAVNRG